MQRLAAMLAAKGRNGDTMIAHINPHEAAMLQAMGGSGTVNPKTGALEFWDTDPMGGAADYGGDNTGTRSDMGMEGGKDEGDRARDASRAGGIGGFNDSRTTWDRISDWAATGWNNAKANPIATMIDFAIPGPLGLMNMASKTFGGPSIGYGLTSMGRSVGQAMGFGAPVGAPNAPQGPVGPNVAGTDPRFALARALAGG